MKRWAAGLGLVAAALVLGVLGARTVLAGPPSSQILTFRDHLDGALTLTIEADPQAAEAGKFALRVPGRGVYVSRGGAQLRLASPTSILARYAGEAELLAIATTGVSRTVVPVTLEAQLDPLHHTAQATLAAGGERFHLVQPAPGRDGISVVLASFERALAANDWRSLYALTTTDITANIDVDSFVAQALAQQSAVGTTTAVQRLALGEVQSNPAGLRFFVATYAITQRRADGMSATTTYDAYFVLEQDVWKLWFTAHR